ncbi:hypothetical protein D2V17_04015 [Aurantiacibacter xanthus]|uniref:Uncharacterized protein n=1 Tax=Aurantiacibacter xanthus TaxID=1784712 RepID=A0A3A1PB02_9SPHN|nr:hypothetical protein [Aurantiacibacter xanthus]RIV90875.1 hypothetical protein D2V17_04015 [Aurantiacibacter xanthus]
MTDKTDLAPEVHNSEQDDESTQAQSVAERAGELRQQLRSPTESTKSPNESDLLGDSTQDLVDHMRDMESSGRIDMDAFRGEPAHDDDESLYRPSARPEDDS